MPRYLLIDGNALVHRAFHALPPMTTQGGEATNAVYGFTMILLRTIKDLKPTHIACAFDLAGPTFRHEKYKEYKGTRVKAAQELYDQIPRIKEVVAALNIPIFEKQGFEADDVLGTLAKTLCEKENGKGRVMILTGDLDTLQLVNNCIHIYTIRKGLSDMFIYDPAAVRDRFGLRPDQMLDYKALRGDPSDNIKGVTGIGEKGAAVLIKDFGSIEKLYEAIQSGKAERKIKPKTLQLLIDQEKDARFAYELSTIVCNVEMDTAVPAYEFTTAHVKKVLELFHQLEFQSLVAKLPKNYHSQITDGADVADEEEQVVIEQSVDVGKQNYILIDSEKAIGDLVGKLKKSKILILDTETTGLHPIDARLVGISVSIKAGEAYYIPARFVTDEFKAIIADEKIAKVGHNIKFDYLILQNEGIVMGGVSFDTMIASYLLSAGSRQHGLDASVFNELGYRMQPIEELIGTGKKQITMDQVEESKVSWYAAEDADMTLRLKEVYEPRLKEQGVDELFRDIEMPLIEVLASMERQGIRVDKKLLQKLSGIAEIDINSLEKEIYKLTGEEFNIASPKQLKEVLFDKLKLIPIENRKTKTGLSTAAGELEKMFGQHPVIEKILEYRELTKLQSTYLLALPELINGKTGRIHTSYNQTIAATGRLSSVDPNLQNIPVRGTGLGAEVRKAFTTDKGFCLLSLDYSQIELRVVAHLAKDKKMSDIFKRGEDIHSTTAMAVFGVDEKELTADMRRDAKTINFGILYGLSSFGLSNRIGEVSRFEAKQFIDAYFAAYPGVKSYIDQIKAEVNQKGFITNQLGRIRRFPEIRASQYMVRQAAERQAVNFPIQSLAADVIKVAMINIYNKIKDQSDDIRMLLQVHDELVFEVKEDKVDQYVKIIKPMMEEAIKLSVPVVVEAKWGSNWGEMEKV